MKKMLAAALFAPLALSLAACGGKGDDSLGDQVEERAENQADAMESAADNLEDQADAVRDHADAVRDHADEQSDAIDDADVDARAMPNEQKAALVNGAEVMR